VFFNAPIELPLPGVFHLVAGLVLLALYAWRTSAPALRRWRPWLAALALWAWVFSTPALGNLLVRQLEGPPDAPRPVVERHDGSLVIVLGSGQMWAPNGTRLVRLDEHGWERLHAGVALWRQTGGAVLFTGGPPGDDTGSIAALMGGIARELGVPAEAIRHSPRSRNTYEDLAQVQDEIRRHPGPVWLVTSALHMPRALAVARRLQLDVRPWPVDYRQIADPTWRAWLPHNGGPERFAAALHEIAGLWLYRLRGQAQ